MDGRLRMEGSQRPPTMQQEEWVAAPNILHSIYVHLVEHFVLPLRRCFRCSSSSATLSSISKDGFLACFSLLLALMLGAALSGEAVSASMVKEHSMAQPLDAAVQTEDADDGIFGNGIERNDGKPWKLQTWFSCSSSQGHDETEHTRTCNDA